MVTVCHDNVNHDGISRNIVECKLFFKDEKDDPKLSISRNIVECKFHVLADDLLDSFV